MVAKMELGKRLRAVREARGLTLGDVEGMSAIGISSLSDYENSKREPRLDQLKRLADLYKLRVSYFLDEEEVQPKEAVLWRQRPESPRAEELEAKLFELAEQY